MFSVLFLSSLCWSLLIFLPYVLKIHHGYQPTRIVPTEWLSFKQIPRENSNLNTPLWILFWFQLCPPEGFAEILSTSSTSRGDLIWKQVFPDVVS